MAVEQRVPKRCFSTKKILASKPVSGLIVCLLVFPKVLPFGVPTFQKCSSQKAGRSQNRSPSRKSVLRMGAPLTGLFL